MSLVLERALQRLRRLRRKFGKSVSSAACCERAVMTSPRSVYIATSALLAAVCVSAAYQDPAWVLPGEAVPSDSIRLTALGTRTPSVYKEQVIWAFHTPSCIRKLEP